MFWNNTKKREEKKAAYKPNFQTRLFDYGFCQDSNIYIITAYYIQYEMTEQGIRDYETWFIEQKELFEKSQRLKREFNIDMPGAENVKEPTIAAWYAQLPKTKEVAENVQAIDLNKVNKETEIVDGYELQRRFEHPEYYTPREMFFTGKYIDDYVTDANREAFIQEDGIRYIGRYTALENSIGNYYSVMIRENPKHIPTLAEWYKDQGIFSEFKKEKINQELAEA